LCIKFFVYVSLFFVLFSPVRSELVAASPAPLSQEQMQRRLDEVNTKIKNLEEEKKNIEKQGERLSKQSNDIFFTDAFNSRVYGDQAQVMKNRAHDIDQELEKLNDEKRRLEMYLN